MQGKDGQGDVLPGMDDLDRAIIDILRFRPRATNRAIADQLSVTAATVSARLRRLDEARAIRLVAVADFAARDYTALAAIGVKVAGRCCGEVAGELAALPEVLGVNVMNGPYEIELLVAFREFRDINAFLLDHVAAIEGVSALAPAIAAEIVKFEFNVAPL
jgi:Lrp/AsnC family transcriptional regulator for asnA, asnC and gidA